MKLKAVLTAALLLAPTAALAAPGITTESAGLRAGPGAGFPLVDRIPAGARVNIHGCLNGDAWCDVSWSDDRGWVSSQYLEYLYHNSYVYLPDYVDEIDVPVVPFVLSSYWSSYYSGRPWYQRRAHWSTYWTSHQREASRLTVNRSAARIGRAATRNSAVVEGREGRTSRTGIEERGMRERNAAQIRGGREMQGRQALGREAADRDRMGGERIGREQGHFAREQGRFAHQNNAARVNARMQPPMARTQTPHISAAPQRTAMPRVAQPAISHGAPMNARGQAPMPHAAPAMPHAAPQVSAAPRGGGAPAGGSGHQRH